MSRSYVSAELRRLVRERAHNCCEYCGVPESMTLACHEIDHVIAEKHSGPTVADNLAISCALCNSRKGTDLSSVDPETGGIVLLYNPRLDKWADHFRLTAARIEPLTPTGRATARLLQLNHPDRIEERALLLAAGALTLPSA